MNLKEGFRYQKFLNDIIDKACNDLTNKELYMSVTKTHHRQEVNPEAEDVVEVINTPNCNYTINDVLYLLNNLIDEKDKLSHAIGNAKAHLNIDIDANIETNKQRQLASRMVKFMTNQKPTSTQTLGTGYKFNVEGNQATYFYNIDVEENRAYDYEYAKNLIKSWMSTSDTVSAEIDQALINTNIEYNPPFDVNSSYEDVIEHRYYNLI